MPISTTTGTHIPTHYLLAGGWGLGAVAPGRADHARPARSPATVIVVAHLGGGWPAVAAISNII